MARMDTGRGPVAGTATFLVTGVERSTPLWEMAPDFAAAAVDRHLELIDTELAAHGGSRAGGSRDGDSVLAVFGAASDAVAAGLAVQRAFAAEAWPGGVAIRLRIGIHTGEVRAGEGRDHSSIAAHHCVRLQEVARASQILLSSAAASLVADALPDGSWLDDLGVHRLRDLSRSEHVFQLCHGDLVTDFPPLRSLDVLLNNLPAQLTSFVGRVDELVEVERVLREHRLVTLAGSGGCGKSRLAAQVAANLADRWPDGVWWVDLGSVTDPGMVVTSTASTMRVPIEPASDPLAALASQLRGRRLLLCIDTCEHLVDACAALVDALLRSCPDVSVLATSRASLGVAGEAVWRVPSLVEDEAVRLFVERACLVRPGYGLDTADAQHVRAICRRLDGIPLAIELAAAWMHALTPPQIAAGLDDRFRLLAGGPRVATPRQQTLAASMQWSHDLLDEVDRIVFRRLAVFAASFTLDAARAVCADAEAVAADDVLTVLGRLVDTSLVVVHEDEAEVRYQLLDTVRQYADDRLLAADETAIIRDRYLDYFLAMAEQAEPELERDQDTWRRILENDHDNLRSALGWGLAAVQPERGRRLAAALARFWFLHGHIQQGSDLLNQAIELASDDDRSQLQARLVSGAAMVALGAGRPAQAAAAAARDWDVVLESGDDASRARCLAVQAYGCMFNDYPVAHDLAVRAQEYGNAAGDRVASDLSATIDACVLMLQDRHDEAAPLAQQVFERTMPRGERFCAVFARAVHMNAAFFTGDMRRAHDLAVEAVRIAEPLGDYFAVGHTIGNLAWIKAVAGEIDAGRELLSPVARLLETAGPDIQITMLEPPMGRLHLFGGDLQGAAAWFERGTRFADPTTDNWVVASTLPGLAGALRRLGRLDEARAHAERGIALARKLGVPNLLAASLDELAFLVASDQPDRAEDVHHEALAVRLERGLRTFYVDSLEALAGLATRFESHAEAVRLIAACEEARDQSGYPRPPINQPDHDDLLAGLRTALGDDAFADAWSEGANLSLDDAVAYATRARGTRDRPSTGWASLTPTELDVVRLVARGFTNPEIGARLFISRATVKTHLAHIYAKLNVGNRTELATLASGHEQ